MYIYLTYLQLSYMKVAKAKKNVQKDTRIAIHLTER